MGVDEKRLADLLEEASAVRDALGPPPPEVRVGTTSDIRRYRLYDRARDVVAAAERLLEYHRLMEHQFRRTN